MSGAAAGAAAAAAAAAERARQQAEEERMTTYGAGDLEGWEFKILRSSTRRALGTPEGLAQTLAEEARAGWELVEKFDDYRVRLKRRIELRAGDRSLPFDAYRTWVGMHPNTLALWVLAGVAALIGVIGVAAAIAANF